MPSIHSTSPSFALRSSVPVRQQQPQPQVTPAPSPTGPSPTVQQAVSQSQHATQQLAQTTSPSAIQNGHTQIANSSSASVSQNHQATPFAQSRLGQAVETVQSVLRSQAVQTGITLGSQAQDIAETEFTVPLTGDKTNLSDIAETTGQLLEGTTQSVLEGVSTVLQVSKAAHSVQEWYTSNSTTNEQRLAAAQDTFVVLGGQSTVKMSEQILKCCQERTLDSTREMLGAVSEFATDESYVAQTERYLLSCAAPLALGSTATGYLAQAVPVLNYGVAAMDTGVAVKKGYDWWQGQNNVSGKDALQSVITAIGSGTGATVAPVVGPLAAKGLNLAIDGVAAASTYVSSAWTSVSNWWNS